AYCPPVLPSSVTVVDNGTRKPSATTSNRPSKLELVLHSARMCGHTLLKEWILYLETLTTKSLMPSPRVLKNYIPHAALLQTGLIISRFRQLPSPISATKSKESGWLPRRMIRGAV